MENRGCGTLYVVATPIGNLEDITLRALRVLKSVDLIAAENVRHTRGLCEHYGIQSRLVGYNQHNQKAKAQSLIQGLESGKDLALVTDAGTPGISDPGAYLINRAALQGIKITPLPGPSAVMSALSVSGLPAEGFVFVGFLPNKPGKRKKTLRELISETRTMVFFEAPHRIHAMLADIMEILGDRRIVMVREMTKIFEEVKSGPVSSILEHLAEERIRGEFTLVLAGADVEKKAPGLSDAALNRIEELLNSEEEMSVKDIALRISREQGLPYRRVYKECLMRKKSSSPN
ncbi:MAG: 16S rRNA (cytidine(1402)-2'-O)-methyltransferase [Deltaproteobacteria bacterium]|nr:16S rRNA (cytidine(1402)-2'-O)-methyltransferase [Deltaproteobacteria bacterium]